MSAPPARVFVFDAYGTLFDVHAPVGRVAGDLGEQAQALSRLWRQKQLEYSWLRSLMGRHRDFWGITQDALDYALASFRIAAPSVRERLLACYRQVDAYPDARPLLEALKRRGHATAILSNGEPGMLQAAVANAGFADLLDAVLSVEEIGVFKPDPRVYGLVRTHFGAEPAATDFVSSNAWDAAGAAAFGFRVHWINRAEMPWENLGIDQPDTIASLTALIDRLDGR